jgi:glycerol kinase
LATGFWSSTAALSALWEKDQTFTPVNDKQTQKTIELWNDRLPRILTNK